jgi:thioredoxin reductase (NADPH)
LVFEENIPGGLAAEIPVLENYPGLSEGISGRNLIDRMVGQCQKAETEIRQFEKVVGLNFKGGEKIVATDKYEYTTDDIIIASGSHPRTLGVPGEDKLRGRGVSYCAVCDRAFFRNKKVAVIGEGSRAAEVVLYLSELAAEAVLLCLRPGIEAEKVLIDRMAGKRIDVLADIEIKEIKGDIQVKSVVVSDKKTDRIREIEADGVFFQLAEAPNSQLAEKAGIRINEKGHIIITEKGRTNIDGIHAVGDVTNHPVKQVIAAVAQAVVAVNDIFEKAGTGKNGAR